MKILRRPKDALTRKTSDLTTRRAPVFSYHAARAHGPDESQRRQNATTNSSARVKRHYRSWGSLIVIGLILLVAAYVSFLTATPRVVITQTDVVPLRDPVLYEQFASQLLSASTLNRDKLTIDTTELAQQLEMRFPELQNVEVRIPLVGHRLVIVAAESRPMLVLENQTGAYLLDLQGRVLMSAKEAPSAVSEKLLHVTDSSGLHLETGKQVIPKETITFIKKVEAQINAAKLSVNHLVLPAVANELHIQLAGQLYLVKFAIDGDARLQAGTFLALKQKLDADRVIPKEYIDVRVEERAYYK